jgi:hypothetical protein
MEVLMKRNFSIIVILLVVFIINSPVIMAASEDTVVITFDPNGDIDIDISLASYAFGGVNANSWRNTTGGTFTLYNNGTVAMDTQIKTNVTTDEGNLSLDPDGNPSTDKFSIETNGFDYDGFIPTTYSTTFDEALAPNDLKNFDLHLCLGVNLTYNFSSQTITIYFQGTVT